MKTNKENETVDIQRKIYQRNQKIKQRAPAQIKGMVETINKIREVVDDEVICHQLTELASACEVKLEPVIEDSIYSSDKKYCYDQSYIWDTTKPYVLFIFLNPQKSRKDVRTKTITRCLQFAKDWNNGGVHIANLFAFVASNTKDLMRANDPIGPDNDEWLVKLAKNADNIIAAWGNGAAQITNRKAVNHTYETYHRADRVSELIPNLSCLGVNEKTGEPTAQFRYLKNNIKSKRYVRKKKV